MASAETYACHVDAWQTGNGSDWASYRVRLYRRNNAFWGNKTTCRIYLNGEYPHWWACPEKSAWNWDGSNYYLLQYGSYGSKQYLSWEFWAPQAGYITGSDIYYDRTVYINRGNSRQGQTTVRVGALDNNYWWGDCLCDLTLSTTRIADVSNIAFTISCDDKTANPRYIRINASYSNPDGYYTGHISGPGINTDFTNSYSATQLVDYNMFNTTRTYTLTIRGKDGTQYHSSSRSVTVEPGGVGVWRKENNQVEEVFHVYYKNNQGQIIEVTELWYRRNSVNVKTVK